MSEELIPTAEKVKKFSFQIAWKEQGFKGVSTRIAQLANANQIDPATKARWNDAAQQLNQELSQAQQRLEQAEEDYKNDDSKDDQQPLEEWAIFNAPQLRNAVELLDARCQALCQIGFQVHDPEVDRLLQMTMSYRR